MCLNDIEYTYVFKHRSSAIQLLLIAVTMDPPMFINKPGLACECRNSFIHYCNTQTILREDNINWQLDIHFENGKILTAKTHL